MIVIKKLKALDLTEYPITEIDRLFANAGKICIMLTDFHQKKEVERAVNNSMDEPEFNKVSRISFKPAKFNNNYLRASTPKNTMFYGSVFSEDDLTEDKFFYKRIISTAEVSTLMRSNEIIEGVSRITFGNWEVIENISLATIIDPTKDYKEAYLSNLKKRYIDYLSQAPLNIRNNTMLWLKYLTDEFSKKVSNGNNHDYLISAKFTELFIKKGEYDGVIYPSVQTNGYGLCVAIRPEAVSKLKLTKVLQCRLTKTINSKNENEIHLFSEKSCLVKEGASTFILKEIEI